jgi:hypothetical protein
MMSFKADTNELVYSDNKPMLPNIFAWAIEPNASYLAKPNPTLYHFLK